MHLLPYENYIKKEIGFLDLPFYLSWKEVTILSENNDLPLVKKITAGSYPLYNGSCIETAESEWFHPNNLSNKDSIQVKIKTNKENNNYEIVSVSKEYLKISEQLPNTFLIKPKDKNYNPPIYDDLSAAEQNFIGNLSGTSKVTVMYKNNSNNIQQIIFDNKQQVTEVPSGITFDANVPLEKVLIKDIIIYQVLENDNVDTVKLFSPDEYMEQFREKWESVLKNKQKVDELYNREKGIINQLPKIDDMYIAIDVHYAALPTFMELRGGELLQSHRLVKKIIKSGLKLKQLRESRLPDKQLYTIHFDETCKSIYTDITRFETEEPVRCTVNAAKSADSERGIPCFDSSGYIRDLLVHDIKFRPISGSMENGQKIDIDSISGYDSSKSTRYIFYEKGIRFYGESVIHNTTGTTGESENIKLKEGIKIYNVDKIGKPGKFIGPEDLCHLEVFINNEDKINDLFRKKHMLNVYNLLFDNVYEKEENNDDLPGKNPVYRRLQDRSVFPKEYTVFGYQLQEASNGYFCFKYKEKEYFIRTANKAGMAENLLDFNQYFIQSNFDKDNDIFCDDETVTRFKAINHQGLRKYVCRFPFEWDAALYAICDDNTCDECQKAYEGRCEKLPQKLLRRGHAISSFPVLTKIMKKADIRSDVDFLKKESMVWHFNPVAFYNHYSRLLQTQSFNPYKSKNIHVKKDDIDLKERTQLDIKDNPGFAPLCPREAEDRGEYNGVYYGYCTSLFNIPRPEKYGNLHTGIDLATKDENTNVISLIYGEVWECSWMGGRDLKTSFGKIMLIKGINDDKLYLLAHLEGYLKQSGDKVWPGEPVAITGTTGNSTGIHLHVEVYINVKENYDNRLNLCEININSGLTWKKRPTRVNPFVHTEEIGQWDGK